jgi:hypothetical protein
MKDCLEAMTTAHIELLNTNHMRNGLVERESWFDELARRSSGADHVCAQTWCPGEVKERLPTGKLTFIPNVFCDAYQPDSALVHVEGSPLPSLARLQHSKLAVFGYCHGMARDDILALYREDIFRELGYLDGWSRTLAYARAEQETSGWPFVEMMERWRRGPCFMLNQFHPKLWVHADMSRHLAKRLGIEIIFDSPEQLVSDPHAALHGWPVYPPIAARFDVNGSYLFYVPAHIRREAGIDELAVPLDVFVDDSLERYREVDRHWLEQALAGWEEFNGFDERLAVHARKPNSPGRAGKAINEEKAPVHPYMQIASHQRWRFGVADPLPAEVDPVVGSKFRIDDDERVATAGSCFAQHISRTLKREGFNFHETEASPGTLTDVEAKRRSYGVYSARYGNIYTARQLLQLFQRANGGASLRDDIWQRPDGSYIDPFRPQVEPGGFASTELVLADRERHLAAVRTMFETLDVFVFTLGLTEAWRRKADGAVLPVAPGVAGGLYDPHLYEFVNFTVDDVIGDMRQFWTALREINPSARMILTVSPVPLAATYEPRHVLTATTYSKSVLRVAAETLAAESDACVYFPSFEIITGNFNRGAYYDEDLRSVTQQGVDHVMRLFLRHMTEGSTRRTEALAEEAALICEDDLLL